MSRVISREHGIVHTDPERFQAWPSIDKRPNGELLVVFSDRLHHIDPTGRIMLTRSRDGGHTWSDAQVIYDSPLDDRDPGVTILPDDTVIVTWFSSIAFANPKIYDPGLIVSSPEAIASLTPELIAQWVHRWLIRSPDGGKNWEDPVQLPFLMEHGPTLLHNGQLLGVKSHQRKDGSYLVEAMISEDRGNTWYPVSEIPSPKFSEGGTYLVESHALQLYSGKILAAFRYEDRDREWGKTRSLDRVWFSESDDGGKTWSPAEIRRVIREDIPDTVLEGSAHPPHLLQLKNGTVLCSYGRRFVEEPYRIRGCFSFDEGATWDYKNELMIQKLPRNDDGYPASVELEDGTIVTVYYQKAPDAVPAKHPRACIGWTRWRV